MNGLWADGWFYISSTGLLVSGVLFFFLLSQYRAAADAADATHAVLEHEAESFPVRPVYIPTHDEPAAVPKVASADSSPAVVYLENIKTQLEGLHVQVAELAKRVESVTSASRISS